MSLLGMDSDIRGGKGWSLVNTGRKPHEAVVRLSSLGLLDEELDSLVAYCSALQKNKIPLKVVMATYTSFLGVGETRIRNFFRFLSLVGKDVECMKLCLRGERSWKPEDEEMWRLFHRMLACHSPAPKNISFGNMERVDCLQESWPPVETCAFYDCDLSKAHDVFSADSCKDSLRKLCLYGCRFDERVPELKFLQLQKLLIDGLPGRLFRDDDSTERLKSLFRSLLEMPPENRKCLEELEIDDPLFFTTLSEGFSREVRLFLEQLLPSFPSLQELYCGRGSCPRSPTPEDQKFSLTFARALGEHKAIKRLEVPFYPTLEGLTALFESLEGHKSLRFLDFPRSVQFDPQTLRALVRKNLSIQCCPPLSAPPASFGPIFWRNVLVEKVASFFGSNINRNGIKKLLPQLMASLAKSCRNGDAEDFSPLFLVVAKSWNLIPFKASPVAMSRVELLGRVHKLQGQLIDKAEEIAALAGVAKSNAELEEENATLEKNNAVLEEECAALKTDIGRKDKEIAGKDEEIAGKDEEIAALKAQLNTFRKQDLENDDDSAPEPKKPRLE